MYNKAFYYRVCLKYWKKYVKRKKGKKRLNAYLRNKHYRKHLKEVFKGWQKVSHQWGKERIAKESAEYRLNLETERLTVWTQKVD